jgi:PAS domain S-box-containing protein
MPATDASPRDAAARGSSSEAPISILLVDDDPRNLLALESTLEGDDHRLVTAQTAEQALLALMEDDFAAIVLDVQMPDLDGIQLARLIKQRRKTQHIPILFLTAHYRESEHAVLGYDVGAVDYLTKPVHPGVLRSKVAVFVELFRKTRALAEINRALEEEVIERKTAEERFRVVVDAAPSAMLVLAQDGDIRLVNPQAEQLFGLSREALLLKAFKDLVGVDPLNGAGEAAEVRQSTITRADGGEIPVEIRLTPIESSDEEARWLASIVDITERKRVEEALRAQAEAEAANAAKDRFLAMLSHELRTPLSPVLHSVALLNEDPTCPEDIRRDLQVISRNVQLEARLIDDLLDVARIRNGKLELQMRDVNAHDLLRNALEICAPEISARQLQLTTEFKATDPGLQADPARLQQIFWNLINNALKFTPEGGQLSISTRNAADGRLEVEVSDSGAGIAPDQLHRIFDAFEQASKPAAGGLGLGLAICKALTELHGGSVTAQSEGRGCGSTFTASFPVSSPEAAPAQHTAPPPEAAEPAPLRVLLVEDHQDTADTLKRLLLRRRYEVKTANSVTAALQAADEFDFDVVVTDIGLPDGNGVDLFQDLRLRAGNGSLYGIALSGFGMDEDINRSLSAGFTHHITKPIEFAHLHRCLKEIGQKLESRRVLQEA